MAHVKNHDYQILPPSIWPFLGAISAFVMLTGAVAWMKGITVLGAPIEGPWMFLIGFVAVLYVMFGWWADVIEEGEEGEHTPVVRIGLQYGFILFIMSEVMFFVAWFWAFFKNALYPMGPDSPIKDGVWPPEGITTFDPWHLPLINTILLVSSSFTVTFAHHALKKNKRGPLKAWLALTILLGAAFLVLQVEEYIEAYTELGLTLGSGIYGATFFMLTGFHGAHVTLGAIILTVMLVRILKGHFDGDKHFGFEAASWYWHFVDVVWLGLFIFVYVL